MADSGWVWREEEDDDDDDHDDDDDDVDDDEEEKIIDELDEIDGQLLVGLCGDKIMMIYLPWRQGFSSSSSTDMAHIQHVYIAIEDILSGANLGI